jgi:hypothetical protein
VTDLVPVGRRASRGKLICVAEGGVSGADALDDTSDFLEIEDAGGSCSASLTHAQHPAAA